MNLKGKRQSTNVGDKRTFDGKARRKAAHMEIQDGIGEFSSHLKDPMPMHKQQPTDMDRFQNAGIVEGMGYTGAGENDIIRMQESYPTQKMEKAKPTPTPTPKPKMGQVTPGKWETKGK